MGGPLVWICRGVTAVVVVGVPVAAGGVVPVRWWLWWIWVVDWVEGAAWVLLLLLLLLVGPPARVVEGWGD